MSTTFETELRQRAEAAVPVGLSLDMSTVLAAGHRRRTTRLGGALGVVAILVLGGLAATELELAPPSPSAARPHTIGTATAVEVAPGIRATNRLTQQDVAGGEVWWDGGLVPGDQVGQHYGFAAPTTSEVWSGDGSPSGLVGVSRGLFDESTGLFERTGAITWQRDPLARTGSTPITEWEGRGERGSVVWDLAGHVPSRVPSPRTVLLIPSGLANGSDFVELPTFRSPLQPDALLYALTIDESELPKDPATPFRPVIVFVGSDGSVDLNGECGAMTLAACSQTLGGGLIDALLSVGAKLPD